MCTAVSYQSSQHYFGRNLDLEYSYQESVTITPRHFPFAFRMMGNMDEHYAMIGMAYVADGYPLYYDATNEKGLSMAGLNFPGNAVYQQPAEGKDNVSPFEFIPWILSQCATVQEARKLLKRIQLVEIHFSDALPLSPLHWIIADRTDALTVECIADGLKIYDNPIGVLTNNPPFDYHLLHLADYMGVSGLVPQNRFSEMLPLKPYSLGMGSMGLPGDMSSSSRFVRAAFVKLNSKPEKTESASVSQFYHILDAVAQPKGCTQVRGDEYEFTLYSSCCSTDRGIYYYKTYENSQITGVDMHRENLEGCELVSYPLIVGQQIHMQN